MQNKEVYAIIDQYYFGRKYRFKRRGGMAYVAGKI